MLSAFEAQAVDDGIRQVFAYAISQYREGRFNKTEELLVGILRLHPRYFPAWFWLAKTYVDQGEWEKASRAAYTARKINVRAVEPLMLMADAFVRMGEFKAGETLLSKARAMSPGNPRVAVACSQFFRKWAVAIGIANNFSSRAKVFVDEVLAADPTNIEAWFELGVIYSVQKEGEKAVEAFERVLKLSPGREDASLNLGSAYLLWGRVAKAVRLLSALVQAHPDNKSAVETLAYAKEQYRTLN